MNQNLLARNIRIIDQSIYISKLLKNYEHFFIKSIPVILKYDFFLKERFIEDIDLIIRKKDTKQIENILTKDGFQKLKDSNYLYYNKKMPVPIDIHTEFLTFEDTEKMFNYVDKISDIFIADNELNFLLILINYGIQKGYFEQNTVLLLKKLFQNLDLNKLNLIANDLNITDKYNFVMNYFNLKFKNYQTNDIINFHLSPCGRGREKGEVEQFLSNSKYSKEEKLSGLQIKIYNWLISKGFIYGKGFIINLFFPFSLKNIIIAFKRMIIKDNDFYINRYGKDKSLLLYIKRFIGYISSTIKFLFTNLKNSINILQ